MNQITKTYYSLLLWALSELDQMILKRAHKQHWTSITTLPETNLRTDVANSQ